MIEHTGLNEAAADFLMAAGTIDTRLYLEMEGFTRAVAAAYQAGIPQRSGRTRRGVDRKVSRTIGGVEGEVFNDHFAAGFVEYGGARSGPVPALQLATTRFLPSFVQKAAYEAGQL